MIHVSKVTKTFDKFKALDDLNMHVPKGSIYGLVGPNGAGKTTIIRHITGVYRPDCGHILVDGKPIFEDTALKSRIAYIPDDAFFFTSANINEMKKYYKGIYPQFDLDRFEKLHEAFPLDIKRPIRRLSKGMQKQAMFWLSLCIRPDLMILDEPVDGLDPVMRRQVWSLIMEDVAERGTTVLVSSHNLRELEDVCDHVGVMHKGSLLFEHALTELQDNISKVQLVLNEGGSLPENLDILHQSTTGRIRTLIVRGAQEETKAKIAACNPLFFDLIPLSLEEIFVYELGGADYEIKSIIL